MLEMRRFSQLRTSLTSPKRTPTSFVSEKEKKCVLTRRQSLLSFFYIRSTQVSRMPPVVLDLEKPFEVRVELQGSHDDSSTTFGQG